ncbi:MAG: hypothetical protein ITG02_00495 [Patulibacter sp.]|nr:hypothetical protein [Patulibacter sp.]
MAVTGCSEDSDPPADAAAPATAEGAAAPQESGSEAAETAESTGSGSTGTVTVDGKTVTFTPKMCVHSPGSSEFIVSGAGKTDSGEPAYVDASGPNQLTVYLDADPMSPKNDFYEFNPAVSGGGAMDELQGLDVSGSTITAAPEMVRTDPGKTTFDPVGTAKLEVTCD